MKNLFASKNDSIKEILKKLDKTAMKVLFIVDTSSKLLGAISDGDIRRALLQGKNITEKIEDIYNPKPIFIEKKNYSIKLARELLLKHKISVIPIVNEEKQVLDYVDWNGAFSDEEKIVLAKPKLKIPVVIMAGGKGTRMEPFTKILPKPLIPVGDKAIIDLIMDEFKNFGIENFYLTLNFKGEMLKAYFSNGKKENLNLKFIEETDYYGTAGSLKLIQQEISDTFIVSNCDIIVKADYAEALNFHNTHGAKLTVISSIKHYQIPYGVILFEKDGKITNLNEKPEQTITINTGVYIMDRKCLDLIPPNEIFDMPDLIKILIANNHKVLTYPVNESEYIDIGQWDEYRKVINKLKEF